MLKKRTQDYRNKEYRDNKTNIFNATKSNFTKNSSLNKSKQQDRM